MGIDDEEEGTEMIGSEIKGGKGKEKEETKLW